MSPGAYLFQHLLLGPYPTVVVEHGRSIVPGDMAPLRAGEEIVNRIPFFLFEQNLRLKRSSLHQDHRILKVKSLVTGLPKIPIISQFQDGVVPIIATVEPLGEPLSLRDLVGIEEKKRFDLFVH